MTQKTRKKMKLCDAIKKAIDDFGTDVIKDTRLANILSDYCAFTDIPATKQVIKTLLDDGIGIQLKRIVDSGKPWENELQALLNKSNEKHGFRNELIEYVFLCFAYALGWIDFEPEYNNGQEPEPASLFDDTDLSDPNKLLLKLQSEYVSKLTQSITIPQTKLIKKSGYYSASALSALALVEGKINIIAKDLHRKDLADWCENEKARVLKLYYVDPHKQRAIFFFKYIFPVIVAGFALNLFISYRASTVSIAKYDECISKADSCRGLKNYKDALNYYTAAKKYTGTFQSRSYKNKAQKQIVETSNMIVDDAIAQILSDIENNDIKKAKQKFDNFKIEEYEADAKHKQKFSGTRDKLNNGIAKFVNDGINDLALNIQKNKGALDSKGRKQLTELLALNPDNYWLNIIKEKTTKKK